MGKGLGEGRVTARRRQPRHGTVACRPFLWDLARRESTTLSGIIDMVTASSILTRAPTWCCTATLFEVPLVACFKAACACCRALAGCPCAAPHESSCCSVSQILSSTSCSRCSAQGTPLPCASLWITARVGRAAGVGHALPPATRCYAVDWVGYPRSQ